MTLDRSRTAAGTAFAVGVALAVVPLAPAAAQTADAVQLQVVGINDFHGHLDPRRAPEPSVAGVLGGAVEQLRAANPNTVFVSAGDNIGASPFISSSQQDEPTLDALDAMGLAASAVGNHEFDRGYADLAGRVADRADFPYLGANVEGETPALRDYEVVTTASGVTIGFIGVVTRQTASLVSPSGITGITFSDPVAAANRVADALSDGQEANGEADVVVLLAHEGAEETATTAEACAELASRDDEFGRIVTGTNANVDAILGGHTHVVVDCELPRADGRVRPVLEASEYGKAFDLLTFTYDRAADRITAASGEVVPLTATSHPADAEVEQIVAQAQAQADVVGRQVIGTITTDIPRAKTAGGEEDRGSESLLGNFIADVQLAATDDGEDGAQIAFMNPGGLRADLLRDNQNAQEAPGEITYAEAAVVQPFANTLFMLTLTGAEVKQVLEEQYQPEGASRPFLALGVSEGFRYEFDDDAPRGSRIHSITLDGEPLDPSASYRIVTNSFLASGGDNFTTLAGGTDRRDTGLDDLSVLVAHFRANSPITPDTTDRAVPAPAGPGGATTRLAGADRYATSAAISRDAFPDAPVPVVFIATGQSFPDALAAGPAADAMGGPVLLVSRNAVPAAVRTELTRLQPARIIVLGGAAAVSDAVATALDEYTTGTVTRVAGADRYITAARVATAAFPAPVAQVVIATGTDFADALTAGAVGAKTGTPVLLTAPGRLPAVTATALRTLRPRNIAVLGGTSAVSPAVLEQLRAYAVGGGVTRLSGADRYATAARAAQVFWPGTSDVVYLATGRDFPDGLAGVPAAGRDAAPVLLVEPGCMPAATKRELDRLAPSTTVVLGGTATVSDAATRGTACT